MNAQRKFEGPFELRLYMRDAGFRDRLHALINRELPDLTFNEKAALAYAEMAAADDREFDKRDDISFEMGLTTGGGSLRSIMLSLEAKGYIKQEVYQKGRRVWVRSIDKWTKAPHCTVPHWRTIHDKSPGTPTLPIQTLRQVPTTMDYINKMMREGMTMVGAQHELLSRGIAHREMERDG